MIRDSESGVSARALLAVLAAILAGCDYGSGSDIGPSLEPLPTQTFEVLVRGPGDRGVCNAGVTWDGADQTTARTRGDGRADLPVTVGAEATLWIDARLAAVAPGIEPASLVLSGPTAPDGTELGFVVHLPDVAPSAGLTLAPGSSAGGVLDDRSTSGALLEVAPGSLVQGGVEPTIRLRTGRLDSDRIPPFAFRDGRAALPGAGIVVDPALFRCTPGASLSLPNDLGLAPDATCPLYGTDRTTGVWTQVATGTVTSDGTRIVAPIGAVTAGGAYAFVAEPAATTTVIGRIRDVVDDGAPLGGVLVRAGQRTALTDPDGRYQLDGVAAADAAGAPRRVRVTAHGGRFQFAIGPEREVDAVPGGVTDLGDLVAAIGSASRARVLVLRRGRAIRWTDLGIGAAQRLSFGSGVTDGGGRVDFGDIHAGVLGTLSTVPDPQRPDGVLTIETVASLPPARRSLDLRLFQEQQVWLSPGNGAQARTLDATSGARIDGALVFRRSGASATREFVGASSFATFVQARFGLDDEITATVDTASDGRRVRAAFSTRRIDTRWVELPLERALRAPLGAFEPFALVDGTAPGTVGTAVVRGEPTRNGATWVDLALARSDFATRMPVRETPAGGTSGFEVGVPERAGNLVVARGRSLGDDLLGGLEELALAFDVRADPGRVTAIQPAGPLAADTAFRRPGALAGLDPRVAPTDLRFDVAAWLADDRAVHIARGLADNLTVDGEDAVLRLPALAGPLGGARWLTLLRARFTDAAGGGEQRALHVVDAGAAAARPLLPVPELLAPATQAILPASGFTVQFRASPGALYSIVRVRSIDDSADQRIWTALLPADVEEFRFEPLPSGPAIVTPGDYQVSVECVRVDGGPLFRQPRDAWQALIARYVGITALERSFAAASTVEVLVTITG